MENTLGHPLKPQQVGNFAGSSMAAFFPIGVSKALTEKEIEALGGAEKLERMNEAELEQLGLRREIQPHNEGVEGGSEEPAAEARKIAASMEEHVRWVEPSENIEKLFEEMGSLSKENQVEYGLVKRADGRLEMVGGGPDRISFLEPPREIIAHTHVAGGVEPSFFDLKTLEALEQESTIIIDANTGETGIAKL